MNPILGMLAALVLGSGYVQAESVSASKKGIFSEAIDDITQAALNQDYRLVKVQEVDRALVKLVSCHASNVGYSRLSLTRAFSVVNCQFTLARI